MKIRFALILFVLVSESIGQEKIWERLGLSQTEWKMVQDNNIPINKVEKLLKDGIGISEYVKKPWIELKITEDQWISKRRDGLTNYDIELQAQVQSDTTKRVASDINLNAFKETDNSAPFALGLFPGYVQLQQKRNTTGAIMLAVLGSAVVWNLSSSAYNGKFDMVSVGLILLPDVIWSLFDIKFNSKEYSNYK